MLTCTARICVCGRVGSGICYEHVCVVSVCVCVCEYESVCML